MTDKIFSPDDVEHITEHRRAVAAFDEKLFIWTRTIGQGIKNHPNLDDDMITDFLDIIDNGIDTEGNFPAVAILAVDHFLSIDSADGELETNDGNNSLYRAYVDEKNLLVDPNVMIDRFVRDIENTIETYEQENADVD